MAFTIISAGAGSGKTTRLTTEMVRKMKEGYPASGIIATTFTEKAAAELQSRVRLTLLKEGMHAEAEALNNALIGTVHSLGVKLLQRFAFEAGVSPKANIITADEPKYHFNLALAKVLNQERVEFIMELSRRLGLEANQHTGDSPWRNQLKVLTELARTNNFSPVSLKESAQKSIDSMLSLLPKPKRTAREWDHDLLELARETLHVLKQGQDQTGVTEECRMTIADALKEGNDGTFLTWENWARLAKLKPGAKSKEAVQKLKDFAADHGAHPRFHEDIRNYIAEIFEVASLAMEDYRRYKNQRGLVDFTDMEVQVDALLDQPEVCEILRPEVSILMVDEFQDTSPIQLSIFMKLAQIARHTIWVGDPKQSIYGFRGAEPALMRAIIDHNGGIRPEDIQRQSFRSREDLVHAVNALFTRGFDNLPTDQVALSPIRRKDQEPAGLEPAFSIWALNHVGETGGKSKENNKWRENALASALLEALKAGILIPAEGGKGVRHARAGDVAILCRSNSACQAVAGALVRAGLTASLALSGLFTTLEGILLLACLRYLQAQDPIALSEILLYGEGLSLEQLVADRISQLASEDSDNGIASPWGSHFELSRKLDNLRKKRRELSVAEMVDQILTLLDLRRLATAWGNPEKRLANLEQIRAFALSYEKSCRSLYEATSLNGFIHWCQSKAQEEEDAQGFGEDADAIRVLTYHRSKGLEWPVVVLWNLDGKEKDRLEPFTIVTENKVVNLADILGNRWVRLWIDPYGRHRKGTQLGKSMEESTEWTFKRQKEKEEEIRIAYVGFTRARDCLILPQSKERLHWVNRIWYPEDSKEDILDKGMDAFPLHWAEQVVPVEVKSFSFGNDFPVREPNPDPFSYLLAAQGEANHLPKALSARELQTKESMIPTFRESEMKQVWQPGLETALTEGIREAFAQNLEKLLTAHHPDYKSLDRENAAHSLLSIPGLLVTPGIGIPRILGILADFDDFLRYLNWDYILNSEEVEMELGGRVYPFTVPMVLESESGYRYLRFIYSEGNRSLEALLQKDKLRLGFEHELLKRKYGSPDIQAWILVLPQGQAVRLTWQLPTSPEELLPI